MASCGKYRSYTIIFKLEVVRYAFNHSNADASRRYGVHRKLVQMWYHQESELLLTLSSRKHLPGSGLKAQYADRDEESYQQPSGNWFSGKHLRREALHVHAEKGDQPFKTSKGWLQRWRRHHNISLRRKTTTIQTLLGNLNDKIVEFHHKIIQLHIYSNGSTMTAIGSATWMKLQSIWTCQESLLSRKRVQGLRLFEQQDMTKIKSH